MGYEAQMGFDTLTSLLARRRAPLTVARALQGPHPAAPFRRESGRPWAFVLFTAGLLSSISASSPQSSPRTSGL